MRTDRNFCGADSNDNKLIFEFARLRRALPGAKNVHIQRTRVVVSQTRT
jgi:hypothetical protein